MNIERFDIRESGEWAFVYLDEDKGTFFAYSSFGTFAYCWYARGGRTLKEFVRSLSYSYFVGKTHGLAAREFDVKATVSGIKEYIIERRRQLYIDKDFARLAWTSIEEIANDSVNEQVFANEVYIDHILGKLYDWDFVDIARYRDNLQCRGFWDVIWPKFLELTAPVKEAVAA